MVDTTEPRTLIKAGTFGGDFESAVKRFDGRVERIPEFFPGSEQYALCARRGDQVYMLVTGKESPLEAIDKGYNVVLTITSRSSALNEDLARRFQDTLEVELDATISDENIACYKAVGLFFQAIEKDPEDDMTFLRSRE